MWVWSDHLIFFTLNSHSVNLWCVIQLQLDLYVVKLNDMWMSYRGQEIAADTYKTLACIWFVLSYRQKENHSYSTRSQSMTLNPSNCQWIEKSLHVKRKELLICQYNLIWWSQSICSEIILLKCSSCCKARRSADNVMRTICRLHYRITKILTCPRDHVVFIK